jgi:hypothetical protein
MDGNWHEIAEARFIQNANGVVVMYLEGGDLRSGRCGFRSWDGRDVMHVDGRSNMSLFRIR